MEVIGIEIEDMEEAHMVEATEIMTDHLWDMEEIGIETEDIVVV